jgi:hypothetical protein
MKASSFVCIFSRPLFCSVEWADLAAFKLKATNDIPVYFIFVYGALNDTLNSTDCTASNKEFG